MANRQKKVDKEVLEMRRRLAMAGVVVAVALALLIVSFRVVIPRVVRLLRGEEHYAGQSTSYWVAALSGKDPRLPWQEAARRLQAGGPSAVPVLAQLIQDEDASTRARAAKVLARIGSPDIAATLAAAQQDKDRDVRYWSAYGLAMAAPDDPAVNITLLLEAAQSADADLNKNIGQAIAKVPAATRVPGLIEGLKHGITEIRFQAVQSLGAMGPEAKEAAPELISLIRLSEVKNREGYVLGHQAAAALDQVSPDSREQAIQFYLKEVQDPQADRAGAAYALGRLRAKPAIAILKKLEKDPDPKVAEQANSALEAIDSSLGDP